MRPQSQALHPRVAGDGPRDGPPSRGDWGQVLHSSISGARYKCSNARPDPIGPPIGGFRDGGLNFDARVRRESISPEDLFTAHIGGMDTFARGLVIAHDILGKSALPDMRKRRYASFEAGPGRAFSNGELGLGDLRDYAMKNGEPEQISGQQERLENTINDYIARGAAPANRD